MIVKLEYSTRDKKFYVTGSTEPIEGLDQLQEFLSQYETPTADQQEAVLRQSFGLPVEQK